MMEGGRLRGGGGAEVELSDALSNAIPAESRETLLLSLPPARGDMAGEEKAERQRWCRGAEGGSERSSGGTGNSSAEAAGKSAAKPAADGDDMEALARATRGGCCCCTAAAAGKAGADGRPRR